MITDNISHVRQRIKVAAAQTGRNPADIKLVAVSKTKPAALIREAFTAGQIAFGENYAQELRDKSREIGDLPIEWHFIGHLQRNKVKYAVEAKAVIETVDSIEIADELARQVKTKLGENTALSCLIEVNIGDEKSKSGVQPNLLAELAKHISSLPQLKLKGLMIIPPYDSDPEKSRPYFQKIRRLFDELNKTLFAGKPLTELSMGMSHDFEVAIEESSTIIRVGTAIFGER